MDFLRRHLNRQPDRDDLDGCALDFEAAAVSDPEADRMLVAEGDEQDEEDGPQPGCAELAGQGDCYPPAPRVA